LLFTLLLIVAASALAQMYKWVDETGTVHYGSRCPDGVECTVMGSVHGPSQAEVEAAQSRSKALAEQQAARSGEKRREAVEPSAEGDISEMAREMVCEKAWSEARILKAQLPVYRDANGQMHHRQSLNDHYYQGARHYLDDEERAQSLTAANAILETQCAGYRPSHLTWVYRFVGPPNLDELLELLEQHPSPVGPPEIELCPYARQVVEEFEAMKTGIPSEPERRLKTLVGEKCR
jgi:hypothetical protein